MDAIETIKTRRSVRDFQDRPVSREIIEEIIDAARFAPTARGVEPWEFVVITNQDALKAIAGLAENGRFLVQAQALIAVFCSDTKYYLEDGCAATQNILLAARALGVGSCWVAGDKKPYCASVNKLLSVPDSLKLVSLIAIGYPKQQDCFKTKERRGLGEIIHWEKF
jgi:nitroreductase